MIKKIAKYVLYGILWGWGFHIILCVIVDVSGFEPLRAVMFQNFTRNVLASTVTGMGFGTTAIVYTSDRLRMWQMTLIHFGVGMGVYFAVAAYMQWIPIVSGSAIMLFCLIAVSTFFAIWSGFYLYNRAEARKINARLREREGEL